MPSDVPVVTWRTSKASAVPRSRPCAEGEPGTLVQKVTVPWSGGLNAQSAIALSFNPSKSRAPLRRPSTQSSIGFMNVSVASAPPS